MFYGYCCLYLQCKCLQVYINNSINNKINLVMEMTENENKKEYASKSVGGTALGLAIAGTALGLLNGGTNL